MIINLERRKGRFREVVVGSRLYIVGKVELGLEGWDFEFCFFLYFLLVVGC